MGARDIRILSEGDAQIVEFIGNGSEVVSVRLSSRAETDEAAISQARDVMQRLSSERQAANDQHRGTPRESLEAEQRHQSQAAASGDLDKALKDTFPASDPVSAASGTTGVDHRRV
ncbi:hypothetical protein SAMN05880582_11236 [Rhizobium sp. RU20A]|uniref:hypothetical protein n=1 Tax=Rhizobium sp. RU20A TaxID=1907412 RepID=UPI00095607CD|nr:hypothetical protein [Rhizobium sp. RU20A]SIR39966.1 hypothetical protein SAMN05880582_11236 [Rhizobium sp. RU20A]